MRAHGLLALLSAAAVLAGCAGTPPVTGIEPDPAPVVRTPPGEPAKPTPPPAARRGGGYYLDDGPGDNAPDDATLAAIPDAVPRDEPLHRFANRP